MLGQPCVQSCRSKFVPPIAPEPDAGDALVAGNAISTLCPNPRFRQFPSHSQLTRIDQFDTVFNGLGHHWDTSQFCAHVFNQLNLYSGYGNRWSQP
jgi:hypothetical protein